MIQMIATDIDGTLLPMGSSRIPERSLQALQRAMDRGITVVPTSGRLLCDIAPELLALHGIRYVISCNGASITDVTTGEQIYTRKLPAGTTADLLRETGKFCCYACAYLSDGPANRIPLPPQMDNYYGNRKAFFSRNAHEDLPAWLEAKDLAAEKIFIAVFDAEEKAKIRRELSRFPGIHVTSSSPWNVEINHIEADKGRAVAWLANHLGIPSQNVAAMGDNENDYTMLTYAGTAVVPANGTEVIRGIATHIVPDCSKCGTAVWIEKEIL